MLYFSFKQTRIHGDYCAEYEKVETTTGSPFLTWACSLESQHQSEPLEDSLW
jgi:hypothetical protein